MARKVCSLHNLVSLLSLTASSHDTVHEQCPCPPLCSCCAAVLSDNLRALTAKLAPNSTAAPSSCQSAPSRGARRAAALIRKSGGYDPGLRLETRRGMRVLEKRWWAAAGRGQAVAPNQVQSAAPEHGRGIDPEIQMHASIPASAYSPTPRPRSNQLAARYRGSTCAGCSGCSLPAISIS